MRLSQLLVVAVLGSTARLAGCEAVAGLQRRQDASDTTFPSLTTNDPSAATADVSSSSNDIATSTSSASSRTGSTSSLASTNPAQNSTSSSVATTSSQSRTTASLTTASATPARNITVSNGAADTDVLPYQPRITPAFGFAGVILIVLGATYAVIGVKSRWIQIFLSSAFLASIATTVLIDYVMSPPVTDAVQGGFLVATVMTGVVFGGGALVFREITEGFACLLGGFCLSMWLLTLRAGGLITSGAGKGVFIGILSVCAWALSWTSYTRPYALIGSFAFSGSTAFTIGIDCFTRAGYKEFWAWIWGLNDQLFPLNTDTFPITRGIKVEIAVIVISTIIGVLAQVKFWKVIKSKEEAQQEVDEEGMRQREAVDTALGRHLERQNAREKSEWEKQYGHRLAAQRATMLWQEAHPEKHFSSTVSVIQLDTGSPYTRSATNLEMNAYSRKTDSGYISKQAQQSTRSVDVIEEMEENDEAAAEKERQKALRALERSRTPLMTIERKGSAESMNNTSDTSETTPAASREVTGGQHSKSRDWSRLKRFSTTSVDRLSKHLSVGHFGKSDSQENLIDDGRPLSRASSAAATMDIENEELNGKDLGVVLDIDLPAPPAIVISPAADNEESPDATVVVRDEDTDALKRASTSGSNTGDNLERDPLLIEGNQLLKDGVASSDAGDARTAVSEPKKAQSQASQSTDSNADTLTKTALATVPSQLSSVVLSYRTNEWAKHITSAEEPIYDEPEIIDADDDELPTQLAPVIQETSQPATKAVVNVPLAETLPPTVKTSGGGVGIASKPPTAKRSFSDQEKRQSTVRPPSRSASAQSTRPSSSSRSHQPSHMTGLQSSLVGTPIDEDAPMEFTSPRQSTRRVSAPLHSPYRSSRGGRPHTAISNSPYHSSYDLPQAVRPASQQSQRPGMLTGTRMSSFNSHQPASRAHQTDAQKRETLLAEWRHAQQHRASSTGLNNTFGEQGRAQMTIDRSNQRLLEEHHKNDQARRQLAMDQMMRRPDVQDLHREAMRKMQAGANKNLKSPTP